MQRLGVANRRRVSYEEKALPLRFSVELGRVVAHMDREVPLFYTTLVPRLVIDGFMVR